MVTEIKADEALLWLRSYHAETVRIARDGMAAWRDLNEAVVGAIQYYGEVSKAPEAVQEAIRRYGAIIEHARKALAERATTET